MRSKKGRFSGGALIKSISIMLLIGGIALMAIGGGAFFGKLSYGIANYNTVKESSLQKNLPMQGTVYYIYDCIVTEYTTSDSGSETVDAYYYAVPFEGDTVLIVKVDADSYTETQMDKLYYAPDDKDYEYMFTTGVDIDGVLIANDGEVLDFFEEWKDTYASDFKTYYNIDISNFTPAAYTLDCTKSIQTLCNMFLFGAGMVVVIVLIWIIVLVKISKGGRNNAAMAGAYNNQGYGVPNYGTQNYGTQNYGGTNNSFVPQQTGSTPQQGMSNGGFIPQSSTNGFQQQGSSNGYDYNAQQTDANNFGYGTQQQNANGYGYGTQQTDASSFGYGTQQTDVNGFGYGTQQTDSSSYGFGAAPQQGSNKVDIRKH